MAIDLVSASSQRIDLSTVPMADTTTLTVMCWAISDTASQEGTAVGLGTNSSFGGYELGQGDVDTGGSGDYWRLTLAGIVARSSDAAITQDTWYHIAITRGATAWALYINGVAQDIGGITNNPNAAPDRASIGAQPESGSRARHFDGKICEVRIWDIELTASQVAAEMVSNQPVFSLSNLKLYMPLDNSTVPTNYADYSGSGITGSPINTPTTIGHTHF